MSDLRKSLEQCFMCGAERAMLTDPPEDIETWPGIPRWVCRRCGNFWIPSNEQIRELGLKVPTARERKKWGVSR